VRRPAARIAWEQFALPLALRRAGVTVSHGAAYAMPRFAPVPSVVTVHDLSFFRVPSAFPAAQGAYLRRTLRHSVRHAAAMIAVSEFTRRELMSMLGADPARIHVVPNGLDDHFKPAPPAACTLFRAQAGLPERYILSVGTIQPRKNLGLLLEAYAALRQRLPDAPDLVVAGAPGWGDSALAERAGALGIASHVHLPGFVSADDLPLLYAAATVFALPSRYEGFGLPVLEAMACGIPTVVASGSSLTEVAGDAALVAGPDDVASWVDALYTLLHDPARAARLAAAGQRQAARFTWRDAARGTSDVYHAVLARAARLGVAA
jgi:glycosyltransferase involved in cell wall biosynthesis